MVSSWFLFEPGYILVDQIIESLLKQWHSPYLVMLLSVASYKAVTSPSDSDNMNIVNWLDRIQASLQQQGMALPTNPNFLHNLRNPAVTVDDSEDDDPATEEGPVKEEDVKKVSVANKEYFLPGPALNLNICKNLVEQHTLEIVLHGLVNKTDIKKLFDIFWKQINPFIGLLDLTLHHQEKTNIGVVPVMAT
ncbi:hypothetical protein BD769DRAFT_1392654 [Suillus cothurnatus]|nr:hypothetical protein BD769DRAFT_1392654 [Suillus cothurnatus]